MEQCFKNETIKYLISFLLVMIDKGVLRGLLDHKKISVLKILYFAKEEMYLREIAKKSGVSVSTPTTSFKRT